MCPENPRSHTLTHAVEWAGTNNPLWIILKEKRQAQ